MSSPLEICTIFMKAMETLDYDTAFKYVSDSVEYINMPTPDVINKGHEAVRAVLDPFFGPMEKNEFIVKNTAVAGNLVIFERMDRHLIAGKWVELPVVGVLEVEDGKVVKWRDYFDMANIVKGMTEASKV